jgi:hypothetical protein
LFAVVLEDYPRQSVAENVAIGRPLVGCHSEVEPVEPDSLLLVTDEVNLERVERLLEPLQVLVVRSSIDYVV